jgi:hypothetical protein
MVQALQEWIAQQGGALLTPVVSITLDGLGEIDGLARARLPDGQEAWLLISAKAKVWARRLPSSWSGCCGIRRPVSACGPRGWGIWCCRWCLDGPWIIGRWRRHSGRGLGC